MGGSAGDRGLGGRRRGRSFLGLLLMVGTLGFLWNERDRWLPRPGTPGPFAPAPTPWLRGFDPAKLVVPPGLVSPVVSDTLLVQLAPGATEPDLVALLAAVGRAAGASRTPAIVGRIPGLAAFQVEVEPGALLAARFRLEKNPLVRSAGLEFVVQGAVPFDDPSLVNADTLDDWGLQRIGAPAAWERSQGDVLVAVVDSGTDEGHEDLASGLEAGHSFWSGSSRQLDAVYEDRYRVLDHGTHVAGTIGARGGNRVGTVGVAPGSRLVAFQVLYPKQPGGPPLGSTSEITGGVERALAAGARILNMSLGLGIPPEIRDRWLSGTPEQRAALEVALDRNAEEELASYRPLLDAVARAGAIVVKSAGNNGLPARFDGLSRSGRVVSVAATDSQDRRAEFSNHGPATTVSAPGVDIYSSYPMAGERYASIQGTSMAAPHVAGAIAHLVAKKTDISLDEVRDILVSTGLPLRTDFPIGPLIQLPAAISELERRIASGRYDPPPAPPTPTTVPTPDPTSDPIVKAPAPTPTAPEDCAALLARPDAWEDPRIRRLIDTWVSLAVPPLEDGPWFYDEWGRALNNKNCFALQPPDPRGRGPYEFIWRHASRLPSVAHGTLLEFVTGKLCSGSFDPVPAPIAPPGPPASPTPTPTSSPGSRPPPSPTSPPGSRPPGPGPGPGTGTDPGRGSPPSPSPAPIPTQRFVVATGERIATSDLAGDTRPVGVTGTPGHRSIPGLIRHRDGRQGRETFSSVDAATGKVRTLLTVTGGKLGDLDVEQLGFASDLSRVAISGRKAGKAVLALVEAGPGGPGAPVILETFADENHHGTPFVPDDGTPPMTLLEKVRPQGAVWRLVVAGKRSLALAGTWYSPQVLDGDGRAALVRSRLDGKPSLHRIDLASGAATRLDLRAGAEAEAAVFAGEGAVAIERLERDTRLVGFGPGSGGRRELAPGAAARSLHPLGKGRVAALLSADPAGFLADRVAILEDGDLRHTLTGPGAVLGAPLLSPDGTHALLTWMSPANGATETRLHATSDWKVVRKVPLPAGTAVLAWR